VSLEIDGEGLAFHPGVYVLRIRAVREAVNSCGGICGVVMEARFLQVYLRTGFKICAKALHNGGILSGDVWRAKL
jgi:hypothetical protein